MLQCRTWLAPGLPLALFARVAREIGARLGEQVTVSSCTDRSGPEPDDDPFARGEVDIGFVCAPSVQRLGSIVPLAAPVFLDPRNGQRPVYFSELVVHAGVPAWRLDDLRGRRIGYNDPGSLSGFGALVAQVDERGMTGEVELVCTGGHHASLRLLRDGVIDAAAVDSNTIRSAGGLSAQLRVVETWGPFPVQPIVARRTLDEPRLAAITAALVDMTDDPSVADDLSAFDVERFVAAGDRDYVAVGDRGWFAVGDRDDDVVS